MPLHNPWIMQDAMAKIVNALLWHCWWSLLGVAISTLTIFPNKVANTSIMDKSHITPLGLHKMQHPKSLTVCWHSVDAVLMLCWCSVDPLLTLCWRSFSGAATSTFMILSIKAAYTSIMGKCHSTALGLYKIQHPNFLTLCWRSFSEWGCDHVAVSVEHKGCQNVDYG